MYIDTGIFIDPYGIPVEEGDRVKVWVREQEATGVVKSVTVGRALVLLDGEESSEWFRTSCVWRADTEVDVLEIATRLIENISDGLDDVSRTLEKLHKLLKKGGTK